MQFYIAYLYKQLSLVVCFPYQRIWFSSKVFSVLSLHRQYTIFFCYGQEKSAKNHNFSIIYFTQGKQKFLDIQILDKRQFCDILNL